MKKFKEFLSEGGNVAVGDEAAQPIEMAKVNRSALVNELVQNLLKLNHEFEKVNGIKIWKNENYVKSGKVFSGSSQHFINLEISDEDYAKHKKETGDIDIQVDESLETLLHEFFKNHKKFGTMEYIGQSSTAVGQISSLFKFNKQNVQIDFEFVQVGKDGMPSGWSSFSRSSAWEDIEKGIKGVMHKFAIACLDHAFTDTIKVQKGKRNPTIETQEVHFFAFSVQHGLRPKYRLVKGEKDVWEAIPSNEGTYTKDINDIFKTLFKKTPSKADMNSFDSFVGIIELVKKYFDKKETVKFINAFEEFLFGRGGQKLYRGRPDKDAEVKLAAIEYIEKTLKHKRNKVLIDKYYENY